MIPDTPLISRRFLCVFPSDYFIIVTVNGLYPLKSRFPGETKYNREPRLLNLQRIKVYGVLSPKGDNPITLLPSKAPGLLVEEAERL